MTTVPNNPREISSDLHLVQNAHVLTDDDHKGHEFDELREEYRQEVRGRGILVKAAFRFGHLEYEKVRQHADLP